jgi:hypothetical protein
MIDDYDDDAGWVISQFRFLTFCAFCEHPKRVFTFAKINSPAFSILGNK